MSVVRVTFDRRANAAYIYLTEIGPGEAVRHGRSSISGTCAAV
jgi:uncharacterized protein YuzE